MKFYYNSIMSNNSRVELHRGTASIKPFIPPPACAGLEGTPVLRDAGIHWQQTAKARLGCVFISLPKQNTSFNGIQ